MAAYVNNSAESDNRKSVERFSVEVWNLTQNWMALNHKAIAELNTLLNARLQLFYAKQNLDGDEKQEEGHAKSSLTYDEKATLQKIVVSSAEKLSNFVESFIKIVSKFQIALERTAAWRKLLSQTKCPTIIYILDTLDHYLPLIIEMYKREAELRKKALFDLGSYEHKDVFTAVAEIFLHEPFIDQNLLGALYALVASQIQ